MKKRIKEVKPDYGYESNLLYSQKLYRKLPYKWLRVFIMIIINIMAWALMIICILFIVAPLIALLDYNPPLMIFIMSTVLIIAVSSVIIRTYSKRGKLLKALKKSCAEPHAKVKYITKPYSTVFKSSHKTDLTIETPDTVFQIMFFPSLFPRKRLLIYPDGKTAFRVSPVFLGRLGMLCGLKPYRKQIDISFETINDASEEKTTQKIILLNPVPKDIYKIDNEKKRMVFSGPGEKFADYTVDNISSLIRRVESNIERY